MSRYTQVKVTKTRLRCEGAPVTIEAHALLIDTEGGTPVAQVKIANATEKEIVSTSIRIEPTDANDLDLDDVSYEFSGLTVHKGQDFGSDTPIPLPETTADFAVQVKSATFSDGSSWRSGENSKWEPVKSISLPSGMRGITRRNLLIAVAIVIVAAVAIGAYRTLGPSQTGVSGLKLSEGSDGYCHFVEGTFTNTTDKTDQFVILTSLDDNKGTRQAIGAAVTNKLEPDASQDITEFIVKSYNTMDFDEPLEDNLPQLIGIVATLGEIDVDDYSSDSSRIKSDGLTIGRTLVISASEIDEAARSALDK